jgi:hypothetical protein
MEGTAAPGKLENAASHVVLHHAVSVCRCSALKPKLWSGVSLCVLRNRLIEILVMGKGLFTHAVL